jgi:hypothetical protein
VGSRTSQAAAHVTRTIALPLQFQPQLSFAERGDLQELWRGGTDRHGAKGVSAAKDDKAGEEQRGNI